MTSSSSILLYMHFFYDRKYIIMKLLLWNVNGLRSIVRKEVEPHVPFWQFIKKYDIVVLNETRISANQLEKLNLIPEAFHAYHTHSQTKQGYSGVSILTKRLPIKRIHPTFNDDEGRVVILEYESFIVIGVYAPNAGTFDKTLNKPKRHTFRTKKWDVQFRTMCSKLEKKKPLIVLGDLNVAHEDIDVYDPTKFQNHAGFTTEERKNFDTLLSSTSLLDVWRAKHPSKVSYSFFNYRSNAKSRNAGWRIDYALVSKSIIGKSSACSILSKASGSDHYPISLNMNM